MQCHFSVTDWSFHWSPPPHVMLEKSMDLRITDVCMGRKKADGAGIHVLLSSVNSSTYFLRESFFWGPLLFFFILCPFSDLILSFQIVFTLLSCSQVFVLFVANFVTHIFGWGSGICCFFPHFLASASDSWKDLYMWVPLNSNVENPNSLSIGSPMDIKCRSLMRYFAHLINPKCA